MDSAANRALGDYGERLACRYLRDRGLRVLERNWRCVRGEIDIVAQDGDCLVVCEVKTRRSGHYGAPFEAVTRRKLCRLRRLAALWLAADGVAGEGAPRPALRGDVRIDVVSILCVPGRPPRVEHLRGVA